MATAQTAISRRQLKETQRDRLLAGMLSAVLRRGYTHVSIAQVISHAKVSRPTFYEYFPDKERCFLAVHDEIFARLFERVRDAVRSAPPQRAAHVALRTMIERAEASPRQARLLVNETPAAGWRALEHRDEAIRRLEALVEIARASAPGDAYAPDLPLRALFGALGNLLAPRLRRNEHDLGMLATELEEWIDTYSHPLEEHRWRTLEPGPPLPAPEHVAAVTLQPPPPLKPGRPSLPSVEVARIQRERILYATAETAMSKGYGKTTVMDIARAAKVEKRIFYESFRDKQEAFLAVHELAFQQMMAVCASAFFSRSTWPERIWASLHAGTHFDATHPVLSHIGYVESHAVGVPAIHRVEDSHAAFKIFLHDGFAQAPCPPAGSALDAIAKTVFEVGYTQVRAGRAHALPRMVPLCAYLILTPFIGREAANEFVDAELERLSGQSEPAKAAR
jgi:AcrR family transcriptional regulator